MIYQPEILHDKNLPQCLEILPKPFTIYMGTHNKADAKVGQQSDLYKRNQKENRPVWCKAFRGNSFAHDFMNLISLFKSSADSADIKISLCIVQTGNMVLSNSTRKGFFKP